MFLEQRGLIKDSTDGPHFLFNRTSSFCKDEQTWNLDAEVRVLISDVVDVLLCVVSGSFMFRR